MVIAKAPTGGRYGTDTAGLLRYLFGPGRANEHTDPHILASSLPEWVRGGEFAARLGHRGGIAALARLLDAHQLNHQVTAPGGHVYHCSISLPAADGALGEQRWAELAEDAIAEMGFGPDEQGRGGCEWVAIHHGRSTGGNDHVHLVVNLVTSSGQLARTQRDWPRWRSWCRRVEHRYGLTPTAPAGAGRAGSSRAVRERTRRLAGLDVEAERTWLREQVAAAALDAASELEFLAGLSARGVAFRSRHGVAGRVTGYAVAGPDRARWVSASTLRRDLSLPRLRRRWQIPIAARDAALAWNQPERLPTLQRAASEHTWSPLVTQLQQARRELEQLLAQPARGGAGPIHHMAAQLAEITTVLAASEDRGGPLHRAAEHLARAGQYPGRWRHRPWTPLAPALALAGDLLAAAPTPEGAVLAAVVAATTVLVGLLARWASQRAVHTAALGELHSAAELLDQHPLAEPKHSSRGPSTARSRAAATAAAPALQPPARRSSRAASTTSTPRPRAVPPKRSTQSRREPPQRGR